MFRTDPRAQRSAQSKTTVNKMRSLMRQLITVTFLTFATMLLPALAQGPSTSGEGQPPPQPPQTLAPVFPVSQVIRVDPQLSQPGALRHYERSAESAQPGHFPIFQASLEAGVGLPWPLPRLHHPSSKGWLSRLAGLCLAGTKDARFNLNRRQAFRRPVTSYWKLGVLLSHRVQRQAILQ